MARGRGVGADHAARRQEILTALLAIIEADGLDAVSLRDVAGRAGVSVGRVQHYFPTKDKILQAAFEHVNQLGERRVTERIAGARDPRTVLRAIAAELLPVDEPHRQAVRIGLAFTARAVVQPEFAEQLRQGYSGLHDLFVLMLDGAEDPVHEARVFLALIEGLATHVVTGHLGADAALAVVDRHLDGVL